MNPQWVKRRWLEFREGYSKYLNFGLNFANFISVQYLAIVAIFLKEQVPYYVMIIIAFLIIVPLAISVGHLHLKQSHPTESMVVQERSPYTYKAVPESKEIIFIDTSIVMLEMIKKISIKQVQEKDLDDVKTIIKKLELLKQGYSSKEILT